MLKAFFNKHPKIHPRRQFRAGVFARLTWWIRQEPRFMLIGAGKCGTTSLEKYITQHPAVEPTVVKELHYFDYMYDHGHDWYRSHFPLVFSKKISGDFTPSYLDHPEAPKRISQRYPHMKFILILRNPIDRAYSQYQHTKRNGDESLSFENAVKTEFERIAKNEDSYKKFSYLTRGLYDEQLSRWFSYFPRENFLVLEYSELENPSVLMDKIFAFLGLPLYKDIKFNKHNTGGEYEQIPFQTRDELTSFFHSHNLKLRDMVGIDYT